jgi:hypothetical protein
MNGVPQPVTAEALAMTFSAVSYMQKRARAKLQEELAESDD